MSQEPFQQRMSERQVIETQIDRLITEVNQEFPDNGDARLRIYQVIGENLIGMVDALRGVPESIIEKVEQGEQK